MKYLIYELFSGVGLCNQLFSFETSIYLANILDRKLILIIKNPLCHCGKASWDYGYLLNFFTNDYYRYLPHGIEVFYKTVPQSINEKMTQENAIMDNDRFSNVVFIDKELDNEENKSDINDFCHYRKIVIFDTNEYKDKEYVYVNKTNASRCFYNFYTTKVNNQLMYDICCSIKFKQIYYDIANKIYNELPRCRNNLLVFAHLRFGDYHKSDNFLQRSNNIMIKNISEFLDCHKTNMINCSLYFLVDNKKNEPFFNSMKRHNYNFTDQYVDGIYSNFINENKMIFYNIHEVSKFEVTDAIIEMILATKADEFIGYSSSTFSHYIQFLRYNIKKTCENYSNLTNNNLQFCRLSNVKDSNIEWQKIGFNGGHPLSWHYFFKPFPEKNTVNFCITNKIDGFGSQLQACFSLIAYCHYKNYNYIHKPFYRMHHNDENVDNFPVVMNNFINLEHEFRSYNDLTNNELSQIHEVKEGYFVHGSLKPEMFYNDAVIEKIRKCYYSNIKPDISDIYKPDKFNVAIHIRRGDVSATKYPSRYTSNEEYIKLIKNQLWPENVQFHLFSQGVKEDFEKITIEFPNIQLHISENIQKTFHLLVEADHLIISKSSFCYCAALLNINKVDGTFIKNWWHKPLKNWI